MENVRVLCADAISNRGIGSRRMGEGGGKNAKRCHSLTDQRINWKLKTKIANTILLLCYLDKMCLSPSDLWQASAFLYSERIYKREPEPAASPQSTKLHSTGNTSVIEGSRPQQYTWNSKLLFFSRWKILLHIVYISNILCGLKVIDSRRLQ